MSPDQVNALVDVVRRCLTLLDQTGAPPGMLMESLRGEPTLAAVPGLVDTLEKAARGDDVALCQLQVLLAAAQSRATH